MAIYREYQCRDDVQGYEVIEVDIYKYSPSQKFGHTYSFKGFSL